MSKKTNQIEAIEVTQDVIDGWKKEHEAVFKISVEGKVAYLRSPDRKTLSYASKVGAADAMKFNEYILEACWLEGDEEIKTKDSLFMSVSGQLSKIIQIAESTLEKL